MLEPGEVQRRLGYHPATPATVPAYELNRSAAILLAEVWNRTLPPGREAALAHTALQEALMWANAAVATCTGPEWVLPAVDVSEFVDDLLERLEGPLHVRSQLVGGGGAVIGSSGGDIGPNDARIAPAAPGSAPAAGERVIDGEVAVATALEPAPTTHCLSTLAADGGVHACALVAGHDDPHKSTGAEIESWEWLDGAEGASRADLAPIGVVQPVEGADRVLLGDCPSRAGSPILRAQQRCELVAGHDGDHRRGLMVWA